MVRLEATGGRPGSPYLAPGGFLRSCLVGGAVAILALACAILLSWWRSPIDASSGRLRSAAFVVAAPSLTATTLSGFALGVLFGALLRRTLAAMGATVLTYLAIRLPWEEVVRPHYATPLTRVTDPGVATSVASSDWIVGKGVIDAAGRRLSEGERSAILREVYGTARDQGGGSSLDQYLADHGLRHVTAPSRR